jgi:ketopantoate reductase
MMTSSCPGIWRKCRMARPREFEETAIVDAAIQCFLSRGYEVTLVRDLAEKMGTTGARLYARGHGSPAACSTEADRGAPICDAHIVHSQPVTRFAVRIALGVRLAEDFAEDRLAFCDGLPPEMAASMNVDLVASRHLKSPLLSGAIVKLGAATSIPTPVNRAIDDILALYIDGRQEKS